MGRVRLSVVATAAIGLAFLVGAAPARSATAPIPGIAFETPSVVDPIHTNGEPDIRIDPFGRVYVSGPTGTGTQRSTWFGSVDRGHTFRVMAQKVPPSPPSGIIAPQPGGGDTEISFDRSGKQYFVDLYALLCLRTATTTDGGAHDNEGLLGCDPTYNGPGADRQWLAVFDPSSTERAQTQSAYIRAGGPTPLIYLEFNNLTTGAQWNKSNAIVDPPSVLSPGSPGINYKNALANQPPVGGAAYTPFGADGYPAIDQVTGNVFQAAGKDNGDGTFSLLLNIGTPNSAGDLTFLDAPGSTTGLVHIADGLPASPDVLFTVLSMDSARNLFVSYALDAPSGNPGQRQVFVSAASPSTDPPWSHWAAPVQVSSGAVGADAVNVFPWIKAGGNGMADAVWYGSDKLVDPSDPNGHQVWNVFMSQVSYNPTSNTLTRLTNPSLKVTPHPMHYDDVCLQGSACIASQGNRNLADFFEVNIDQTGAAEIVYDDTSNRLAQPGFTPTFNGQPVQFVDHQGAGVITVARQSAGTGLFATAVTGPTNAPVSGLRDPAGDALYPVIGGSNQKGMDITSSQLHLSPDGKALTVTMQVVDLTNPAGTIAAIARATNIQYVTRWVMHNPTTNTDVIYYAAMESNVATAPASGVNPPIFYAGKAQSIDLCSVSACFPHVITYPEPPPTATSPAAFTGLPESGSVNCPALPSADNPCTLAITVNTADVGSPTANSQLEEVGGYAMAATPQEGAENNATAQSDTVPLEIDGVCCYNFKASVANGGLPPCHEADGDGDVSDGHGGKAHIHMDKDACEDGNPESIQENDPSTGDNFQSGSFSSVTFNDALSNVSIVGSGTHNGNPVTFTLTAVNGAAGVGAASLTLSDGYSVGSTLIDGAIQLR